MATVNSRKVVDDLIAGDGHYEGDPLPVLRIVEYHLRPDHTAWSLLYPYSTESEWIESAGLPGATTIFEHSPAGCEKCKRLGIESR